MLECFVNEDEKARLKCDRLKTVLQIVDKLDQEPRARMVEIVSEAIDAGAPKAGWLGREKFAKS